MYRYQYVMVVCVMASTIETVESVVTDTVQKFYMTPITRQGKNDCSLLFGLNNHQQSFTSQSLLQHLARMFKLSFDTIQLCVDIDVADPITR